MAELRCKVEDCKRPYDCKGYCHTHYCQVQRKGVAYTTMQDKRPATIKDGVARIPVGVNAKDGYILVDTEDSWVDRYKWSSSIGGYAFTKVGGRRGKNTSIHRLLLSPADSQEVDHINGDKLDNRRSNLRLCTRGENAHNMGPHKNRNQSGFKGVSVRGRRFRASIYHRKVNYHLGYFDTAISAAKAYDTRAKELFGDFAWLNFPKGV